MLSLGENIVGRSQEADVSDLEARFFQDFAGGGRGEGFAVFEVAAGALEGSCARWMRWVLFT
jgi:hypothetical protein